MKNISTAYLVLSVRDIKTLLAAAQASAEAAGDNDSHCIIMRDICLSEDRGFDELQISSHDITTRAEAVELKSLEAREVSRASRNASDAAAGVREFLGMK